MEISTLYSISDANRKLEAWFPNSSEDQELPQKILDAISSDTEQTICGSANEYHNLASEYARKGLASMASAIAALGAKRYPQNIDLLADVIKFGSESQKWEICKEAYQRLSKIDKKRWNWRAFTFSVDYLIDRYSTEEPPEREDTHKEAVALVQKYKESGLQDERAWVAEAELFLTENETEKAVKTLEDGVEKIQVAPQCCIKLADIYLKCGEYEKAIKYSAIGAKATAQEQPSASIAYLYYVSALAKDALIHQEALNSSPDCETSGFRDLNAVNAALADYKIAEKIFRLQRQNAFVPNIMTRQIILREKSGLNQTEIETKDPHANDIARQLYSLIQDEDKGE